MSSLRVLLSWFLLGALAHATGNSAITEAANRLEQQTATTPDAIRLEFRIRAAEALRNRYPVLARKFVELTLEELRAGKDLTLGFGVVQGLAAAAPADAVALLPRMSAASRQAMRTALIQSYMQAHQTDTALKLFRESLSDGQVRAPEAAQLLQPLAQEKPEEAVRLVREIVAAFPFDRPDSFNTWRLLDCAAAVAPVSAGAAAEVYQRIATAASAPGYNDKVNVVIAANFESGSGVIATKNSADSLLVAAGSRLHALAPERFEKLEPMFTRWDLSGPVKFKSVNFSSSKASSTAAATPEAAIQKRMGQLRGNLSDTERSKLAIDLANEIRALPAGERRLNLAMGLRSLSTEGDLGIDALKAVAAALGDALREAAPNGGAYLALAELVRYEHVPAPFSDRALDAAESLLGIQEQIHQENGFTLTALDGKTYSLSALRGKVVLLNFWATWCPPCRKEMPDMEKLYHDFENQGLVVLAVSDEERETVVGFLQKQNYTFPILLDPDRKVNHAFGVEGIPKSFVFDREGRLVAQAIDMRTQQQFLRMLKTAGL